MIYNLDTINPLVVPVFYNAAEDLSKEKLASLMEDVAQQYEAWDSNGDCHMIAYLENNGLIVSDYVYWITTNRHIVNDKKCSVFFKTDKDGIVVFDYNKINKHCKLMRKRLLKQLLTHNKNTKYPDLKSMFNFQDKICTHQDAVFKQEFSIFSRRIAEVTEYYIYDIYTIFELAQIALEENKKYKLAGYLYFDENYRMKFAED